MENKFINENRKSNLKDLGQVIERLLAVEQELLDEEIDYVEFNLEIETGTLKRKEAEKEKTEEELIKELIKVNKVASEETEKSEFEKLQDSINALELVFDLIKKGEF